MRASLNTRSQSMSIRTLKRGKDHELSLMAHLALKIIAYRAVRTEILSLLTFNN